MSKPLLMILMIISLLLPVGAIGIFIYLKPGSQGQSEAMLFRASPADDIDIPKPGPKKAGTGVWSVRCAEGDTDPSCK